MNLKQIKHIFDDRDVITIEDIDNYQFGESEPNDCGVFIDRTYVSCYSGEVDLNYFMVEIAKHDGKYYRGYSYQIDGVGGCCGANINHRSFSTPREALMDILKEFAELNHTVSPFVKRIYDKMGCYQLSLF